MIAAIQIESLDLSSPWLIKVTGRKFYIVCLLFKQIYFAMSIQSWSSLLRHKLWIISLCDRMSEVHALGVESAIE